VPYDSRVLHYSFISLSRRCNPFPLAEWQGEFEKFAPHLKVLCIYDADSLLNFQVQDLVHADCVICPVDILETKGYLQHLLEISGSGTEDCPIIPSVSYVSGFSWLSVFYYPFSRLNSIPDKKNSSGHLESGSLRQARILTEVPITPTIKSAETPQRGIHIYISVQCTRLERRHLQIQRKACLWNISSGSGSL
jgi:hypothetical protein